MLSLAAHKQTIGTIPPIVHYAWFEEDSIPEENIHKFQNMHPDWRVFVWNNETIADLGTWSEENAWLLALWQFGGVCINPRISPIRKFNALLGFDAMAGKLSDGGLDLNIIGARKEHPWVAWLMGAREARGDVGDWKLMAKKLCVEIFEPGILCSEKADTDTVSFAHRTRACKTIWNSAR